MLVPRLRPGTNRGRAVVVFHGSLVVGLVVVRFEDAGLSQCCRPGLGRKAARSWLDRLCLLAPCSPRAELVPARRTPLGLGFTAPAPPPAPPAPAAASFGGAAPRRVAVRGRRIEARALALG